MVKQTANKRGRYLYALVTDAQDRIYEIAGIEGKPVYTVVQGQVAAVVSDFSTKSIRPERRNLAAHQGVLRYLTNEEAAVLPMSFGVIAINSDVIRKTLSENQKAILEQIRRVSSKVEMGLRVTWDVNNIFEYFVATHADLREARDRLLASRHEMTQEDRIEVGRAFDRILKENRESYTKKVEKVLSSCCSEIKRNNCRNEREVMNLACLVTREGQEKFENAIFEAARLFDDHFAFDYNGPWAPHNFVDLNLKL